MQVIWFVWVPGQNLVRATARVHDSTVEMVDDGVHESK